MSTDWVPVLDANWETYEETGDLSQAYLDMVSDADGSVGYYWSTETTIFFRMTLRATPIRTQGDLINAGWFVALDVDRDGYIDWQVLVNGLKEKLETFPNMEVYPDNDPDGTANFSADDPLRTSGHVRVVPAPTPTYPDAVYLDFQVPYTALQIGGYSNSVYYTSAVNMIYAANNNASATITEAMGPATTFTDALANSSVYTPSDPESAGLIYDTRDTAPYSVAGIWYRTETVTVSGEGFPPSTSTYYNSGQRNVRILDSGSTIVWSGVLTTTTTGDLVDVPMWTIELSVLPDIYTIQVENPQTPGEYNDYDRFEIKAPVITVQKTTSTPDVSAGSDVSYSIQIQNTGNIDGSLASIVDNLPTGFSYVVGSATGLTTADPTVNGSQITWAGSWSVPVAGSDTLDFLAKAGTAGNHYNSVTISGDNFAVKNTGDTALITVTGPTLTLAKSVDKASAAPGDTLTYTVQYSNTGDGDATYVFILESIPVNTVYVTDSAVGTGTTITYSHNGGISYDGSQTAPVTNLSFQRNTDLTPGTSDSISFKVIIQ